MKCVTLFRSIPFSENSGKCLCLFYCHKNVSFNYEDYQHLQPPLSSNMSVETTAMAAVSHVRILSRSWDKIYINFYIFLASFVTAATCRGIRMTINV